MSIRRGLAASLLFAAAAWADGGDGDQLMGTWEVEGSNPPEMWTLLHKGDVQTIVRTEAGNVTLNLKCRPVPGECHGIDGGKRARVTMYSKGPALVHWEVKDTNLIIRRFVLEGQTLKIEARQITGPGKSTALRLVRRMERDAQR